MDQTFILNKIVYSYCFQIRRIVSIKTAIIKQVREFGSLKVFSDSLATLDDHWEITETGDQASGKVVLRTGI